MDMLLIWECLPLAKLHEIQPRFLSNPPHTHTCVVVLDGVPIYVIGSMLTDQPIKFVDDSPPMNFSALTVREMLEEIWCHIIVMGENARQAVHLAADHVV